MILCFSPINKAKGGRARILGAPGSSDCTQYFKMVTSSSIWTDNVPTSAHISSAYKFRGDIKIEYRLPIAALRFLPMA